MILLVVQAIIGRQKEQVKAKKMMRGYRNYFGTFIIG